MDHLAVVAVIGLRRLHELGPVRQQAVLQIDSSERGRKLAHVARGRADQAAELAVGPMRGHDRLVATGDG